MFRSILLVIVAIALSVAFSSSIMAASFTGGYALSLDYYQYTTIPNSDSLNPANITVECWVKFRSFSGAHAEFFICKGGHNQGAYNLYYLEGNIFVFELDAFTDHRADSRPLSLSPETWYHVAGVYDGNRIRVLLNGETVGEKKIGYVRIGTTDPLFFNLHIGFPYPFGGDLDEVRLWSVARSDYEIKTNMYQEIKSSPGLVGAWHLNEGTGQVFRDSAGGNDGYLGSKPGIDENDPTWKLSDIQFKGFAVISPAGDEIWQSGTVHKINWIATGSNKIRLEFSSDGGKTWAAIADSLIASTGSYSWTLPQIQSFQCRVRITDTIDPSKTDMSLNDFIISPPFVRLQTPNGGEQWETGTVHSIKWWSLGTDKILIDYSTDKDNDWIPITSEVNAVPDSFVWKVPFTPTTQGRVRIRSVDLSHSSVSESLFTIVRSNIVLINPKGGETFESGTVQDINWTATPGVDSVKVEYSPNGGTSWQSIIIISASSGLTHWIVPSGDTSQGLIRISWAAHSELSATTKSTFSIRTGASFPWTYFPSTSPVKYLTVKGDAVWYVTDTNILRMNRKTAFIDTIIPHPDLLINDIVALAIDSKGVAWFGVKGLYWVDYDFIFSFDGKSWMKYTIGSTGARLNGLGIDSKDVKYITRDNAQYSYLEIFDGARGETISSDGVSYHYLSILTIDDRRHSVWIKSNRGPLEIIIDTGQVGINTGSPDEEWWYSNAQQGVLDAYDNFWFTSANGIISTYYYTYWLHFGYFNSLIPFKRYTVAITPDNIKWFGGPGGLVRYDLSNWEIIPVSPDSLKNSILLLQADADGNIWGITPDGIARYGYIPGPTSVDEKDKEPVAFGNITNYPNPFNPSTTIEFTLPSSGKASLMIYDIIGRKVRELVSGQVSAGMRMVRWDGRDDSGRSVSSGVYIAKLTMGKIAVVKKMLLMK